MTKARHILPRWLTPVLAFLDTVDIETGVDVLAGGPAALAAWLTSQRLWVGSFANAESTDTTPVIEPLVSAGDYRLAIDLRTGLRALALHNNGGRADAAALARARRALRQLPLVAGIAGDAHDAPMLAPLRQTPVAAALGVIVAGYIKAVATGDWQRIRQCPADECAWVFWDSSAKGPDGGAP